MTSVWELAADYAYPDEERYASDPVAWAAERADVQLWSKQRTVIESVRDNPETAVHSCHNTGKSFGAAITCCWWLDSHPPGSAFVVTTAPTGPQVKAILWREISHIHKTAGLPGRTNLTEWYIGGELVAYGRKPNDKDPTGFQGIHAEYVLVILDEACGIPKSLWDAASSLTSNDSSRTLAIGNPDDPHSEFAAVCKASSGWNVIHIGAEHTPNFTGEKVSRKAKASLITPRWAESKKRGWGERSALYTSKVKGLFPTDSEKGTVPWSWAVACRYVQLPAEGKRCAGLDVGAGGDLTVLRERIGNRVGRERTWQEADPMVVAGEIALQLEEWCTERLIVDVLGVGWGLAGTLKQNSRKHNRRTGETVHGAEVVGFNAAEASTQPKRFVNRRSELYWEVGRELSRLKAWDLEEIDDDVLAELTEPEYAIVDSHGKIRVEPRDKIIKKLGHSPDRSTALLLAFWEGSTVEVRLPVSAKVLTSTTYNKRRNLGIAGPKPNALGLESDPDPDREAERKLMRKIRLGQPI